MLSHFYVESGSTARWCSVKGWLSHGSRWCRWGHRIQQINITSCKFQNCVSVCVSLFLSSKTLLIYKSIAFFCTNKELRINFLWLVHFIICIYLYTHGLDMAIWIRAQRHNLCIHTRHSLFFVQQKENWVPETSRKSQRTRRKWAWS